MRHNRSVSSRLFPLDRDADVDHDRVRKGLVDHTIWVPRWADSGPQDHYVDLRWTTSVDAAFIDRNGRVAALSRAAWLAMVDRLSRYDVGVPVDVASFRRQPGPAPP